MNEAPRFCSFDALHDSADRLATPITLAVAGANLTVLEALREACNRGWISPALAGNEDEIRRLASDCNIDLRGMRIVDTDRSALAAVTEVKEGRAKLLMKGEVATPDLLRALLDPASGLRTNRVICQVVFIEIHPAARRFLLADTGITIAPTLNQKLDILRNAVDVACSLGAKNPRVALLAATEKSTESMPDTLDAAEMARRNDVGEITDCRVQGPLSFDLAYAADAADKKLLEGPVVGAAEIMLFPNLVAANLTVKAIMYTADCRFGGILCGAACPVVFMSRADTTATRLNSPALALRMLKPVSET